MNILSVLFRNRNEFIPQNTRNSLKESFVRRLWELKQYHSQINKGGLSRKFYDKAHSFFIDEHEQHESQRLHALKSDAFYALDLIGKKEFSSTEELTAFLADHTGFVFSKNKGITLEEIVSYIQENKADIEENEYLKLMR